MFELRVEAGGEDDGVSSFRDMSFTSGTSGSESAGEGGAGAGGDAVGAGNASGRSALSQSQTSVTTDVTASSINRSSINGSSVNGSNGAVTTSPSSFTSGGDASNASAARMAATSHSYSPAGSAIGAASSDGSDAEGAGEEAEQLVSSLPSSTSQEGGDQGRSSLDGSVVGKMEASFSLANVSAVVNRYNDDGEDDGEDNHMLSQERRGSHGSSRGSGVGVGIARAPSLVASDYDESCDDKGGSKEGSDEGEGGEEEEDIVPDDTPCSYGAIIARAGLAAETTSEQQQQLLASFSSIVTAEATEATEAAEAVEVVESSSAAESKNGGGDEEKAVVEGADARFAAAVKRGMSTAMEQLRSAVKESIAEADRVEEQLTAAPPPVFNTLLRLGKSSAATSGGELDTLRSDIEAVQSSSRRHAMTAWTGLLRSFRATVETELDSEMAVLDKEGKALADATAQAEAMLEAKKKAVAARKEEAALLQGCLEQAAVVSKYEADRRALQENLEAKKREFETLKRRSDHRQRRQRQASAEDEALQCLRDDVRVMGDKYQLLDGLHVWSMSCITASRLTFTFKHGTGATHDVVVDADQADQVDEEEEKEATKATAGGANGCMGGRRLVARLCGPGADAADGETKSSGRGGSDSDSDDDDDDIDGMCQKLSGLFLPAVAAATVPRMAMVANGEDLSRVLLDLEVHFDRASSLVEEVRMLQESVVASPSVSFDVVAVEQVGADDEDEEEEERAAGVGGGRRGAAPLCNLVVTGTNFEKECKVEMTLGLRLGYPFATMDVTVDALFGLSDAHVERIKRAVQVRVICDCACTYPLVAGRDGRVGRGGGWWG